MYTASQVSVYEGLNATEQLKEKCPNAVVWGILQKHFPKSFIKFIEKHLC